MSKKCSILLDGYKAMLKFKTTRSAAKALGVSQSTIVKKIHRLEIEV